ncbi:MAG TPA: dTDP-4-dehydrorhamnose 3,5-epimerase [Bacteroidales bacterium]|nr:dTDP-4-dehydrorhamnose 3,5-epimerase [Bacteroidales bacterium]
MIVETTPFEGLLVIKPRVFQDERGYFFESWNEVNARGAGILFTFAQDNQSMSAQGVLRGLHFQIPPYEQGKLVRVISGSVLDVVVDLRTNQPTFGRHFKITLDGASKTMLFIPPGFAHGFKTLEDNTIFFYKCTKVFNAEFDKVIRWNDPDLAIDWEISQPVLSEKDRNAPLFRDFKSPF